MNGSAPRCPRCSGLLTTDTNRDREYGLCLHCGTVRVEPLDLSWMEDQPDVRRLPRMPAYRKEGPR